MTGIIQKALAVVTSVMSRVFAVAVLTAALAFTVYGAAPETQTPDSRNVQEEKQLNDNLQEINQEVSGVFHSKAAGAFPVKVHCDGKMQAYMVTGANVQGVLDLAGIELGEHDEVNLPLNLRVQEGDSITVTRKDVVTKTQEKAVPFKTVEVPTSLLAPGKEKVLQEGKPGVMVETYEELVVDGKTLEVELLGETVVTKPVHRKVLVGDAESPISELDFGYELDENGEPIGYASVLRSQRAAGYSARSGAKTASGRDAVVGHVAVNPNAIPYGSKLYIKSTDGDFVYGYAVAADTGTAIRDGVIAVDLFYGSYAESALNGIKSVDIFILE